MIRVELIYDSDCPNVAQARAELLRAFSEAGVPARWVEWDRGNPASPPYVRNYGSPTILVNGRDVAGAIPMQNVSCCRIYTGSDGSFMGVPTAAVIAEALKNASNDTANKLKTSSWHSFFVSLPGIGASLLPVGVCPSCLPIYAGVLSSFGFGFLLEKIYLLPITIIFLLVAIGGLAYKAPSRRGYGPFILGLIASGAVIVGKFILDSLPLVYGGVTLLLGASVWNVWPLKKTDNSIGSCPACLPQGEDPIVDSGGVNTQQIKGGLS